MQFDPFKSPPDGLAAVAVTKSFGQEIFDAGTKQPAAPVPALPDSRCQAFPKGCCCVALAGRCAIGARGDPALLDAQQQVVAQYVMLTANRAPGSPQ
jgi:hypothetical protein